MEHFFNNVLQTALKSVRQHIIRFQQKHGAQPYCREGEGLLSSRCQRLLWCFETSNAWLRSNSCQSCDLYRSKACSNSHHRTVVTLAERLLGCSAWPYVWPMQSGMARCNYLLFEDAAAVQIAASRRIADRSRCVHCARGVPKKPV